MTRNNMIKSKFYWKDVLDNYCEISHFHGFHELKAAHSLRGKFFLFLMILTAFSFTIWLIVLLCGEYLNEPVVTAVSRERYGTISVPMSYCPADWIDSETQISRNISDKHLLYALSYLKDGPLIYKEFVFYDPVLKYRQNSSISYCGNMDVQDYLFVVPAVVGRFLDSKSKPEYYGLTSREFVEYHNGTAKFLEIIFLEYKLVIYHYYLQKNSDGLFALIYYNAEFTVDDVALDVIPVVFGGNQTEYDTVSFNCSNGCRPFTLHSIDILRGHSRDLNSTKRVTSFPSNSEHDDEQLCKLIFKEVAIFSLYSGENWFTLWPNEEKYKIAEYSSSVRSMYPGELQKRSKLELYKTRRLLYLLSTEPSEYGIFLKRGNLNNTETNFRLYLQHCCGNSTIEENDKIVGLLQKAWLDFLAEEENDFRAFLKERKFRNATDVWLAVSMNESQLLLALTVDSQTAVRPKVGQITVEKQIKSDGMCFRMQISADTKAFDKSLFDEKTNSLRDADDETSRDEKAELRAGIFGGRLKEKLFVNIVALQREGNFFFRRAGNENKFIIGDESDDFFSNSYNTFTIPYTDEWWQTYYHFDLTDINYQFSVNREDQNPCYDIDKNEQGIKNSYINCIIDCDNRYNQPKVLYKGNPKLANCQYLAESMDGYGAKSLCSFFAFKNELFYDKNERNDDENAKLSKCIDRCQPACSLISFKLKNSTLNCSECVDRERQRDNAQGQLQAGFRDRIRELYENIDPPDRNRPKWIAKYRGGRYSIARIIDYYGAVEDINRTRIEIEINSDVTTYTEKLTFTWYGFLGVIGGQVGLVMSGSVLTVAQLVWWCATVCSKSYKTVASKRGIKQDGRISAVNVDDLQNSAKLTRLNRLKSKIHSQISANG